MKKILLSVAILGVVSVVIVGATTAIFSDAEVSTGNTFTAGAIDLTVDNESYYNGEFNEGTSWMKKDLEDDDWFFDFRDLKPGDWGEDTISLHVNNNPSWLCADVTLTSNQDNGSTEPELNDEEQWTAGRGELGDRINFIAWADDGDNVLESNEQVFELGPIGDLRKGETATAALADSKWNVWEESSNTPLPGDSTRYIGKAWCFGDMTIDPLSPDDVGYDPNVHSPIVRGAGFTCDGSGEDNSTQTDSLTADISFRAEQARHQDDFLCIPPEGPDTATLTVDKVITITNPNYPPIAVSDFDLFIDDGTTITQVYDEDPVPGLTPGTYTITETYTDDDGRTFDTIFALDCATNGIVTLTAGDNLTCQIINIETTPLI